MLTRKDKIELRRSEIRQELATLLDTPSEKRSENHAGDIAKLSTEMIDKEGELRAAIALDALDAETRANETRAAGGDSETRELDVMLEKADMGRIFQAVIEHRSVDGVEGELQQRDKLAGNMVPLDMLRTPLETRAVTPAPSDVGARQQSILPAIFEQGAAVFLGVPSPRVPVGDGSFPVLTTGADVKKPAKNAAAGDTTGAFSVTTLTPHRLQAAFFFAREDAARFAGMSEALRQNLNESLSAKLDSEILNKDDGMLGTGLTNPANPAVIATYMDYLNAIVEAIDGQYASVETDCRMLVGAKTLQHMWSVAQAASGVTAAEKVRMISGGLRVGKSIPAVAGNIQSAIVARALGATHAVAPIWSLTLIPDEVTKAANGQIVITAIMLYDFAVLRSEGYRRLEFKLS